MRSDLRLRILFVCTANLCRSQLSAAQLRRRDVAGVLDVDSAGTRALAGAHIPDRFRMLFGGTGVDSIVAKRLTVATLDRADLVLTMTRAQRSEVVQILPRSVQYTYPLVQFVELAERAARPDAGGALGPGSSGGVHSLMSAVNEQHGFARGRLTAVDIHDPAAAGAHELRRVADEISGYVDRLANLLGCSSAVVPRSSSQDDLSHDVFKAS